MNDPRRPVHRPDEAQQEIVRRTLHVLLLNCTELGAKTIGCNGAAFVLMGVAHWALELAELDGKSSAKLFSALSVLCDPASNDAQKRRAEQKRRDAVTRLLNAVDISMVKPGGSA